MACRALLSHRVQTIYMYIYVCVTHILFILLRKFGHSRGAQYVKTAQSIALCLKYIVKVIQEPLKRKENKKITACTCIIYLRHEKAIIGIRFSPHILFLTFTVHFYNAIQAAFFLQVFLKAS